ncbi:murein hydrolase activator EnvC [Rodentibacter caecimuris]|uniref:M23ase beta-sheet core domain-containing protein n=1 Tax=Rodentibacter caecimuris TaxID=1796644 RepID=A0ABX3KXL1_9PAST|nr:hypothetical protein BKG89_04535 [Rodentibacter heylii]
MTLFFLLPKTLSKMTALLCFGVGFLLFSTFSVSQDLNHIQQQIKQQESKIAQQKREQVKLQSTLKNQESKINSVLGELRETELSLKEIRQQIAQTDKQIKQLEKQEHQQKQKLANQIDKIYRSGVSPSTLERLLSEDAYKAERMKVYYQHLNQARLDIIEKLKTTQTQLRREKENILGQQRVQREQLSSQKKQQLELQKVQKERQSTLNAINRNLSKDESRLETLKANENALRQEIQRAEQAARLQEQREREALAKKQQAEEKKTAKPYQPSVQERRLLNSSGGLGGAKHQYNAPIKGTTLHRFGEIQSGEVRWKGMVISASAGSSVKSIANGRVISAGYLNGYGYMVIIKHGESDLSLYGFNQAVFVKPNQMVSAGQTIAQVGNTGDVSRPALYFGISRKGVSVNPAGWIK